MSHALYNAVLTQLSTHSFVILTRSAVAVINMDNCLAFPSQFGQCMAITVLRCTQRDTHKAKQVYSFGLVLRSLWLPFVKCINGTEADASKLT